MLTVQTVEQIKRGSKFTLWNGIYAIFYGLLYIGFMNFIIKRNFRIIDVVWQVFDKYNPAISSLILKLMILKGLFIVGFGLMIIAFSVYILKKKDKTAWVMLFILGLLFWISLLTLDMLNRNIYLIAASFIGWVTFLIGMLLPIKYYLERAYEDY
jgi:vacuolar-type H+-ATPase subunit I/STV1